MGFHLLPQRKRFRYDAYGRPSGNTYGHEGFNRVGFNRHGVNRGGYDMDGHCHGHQRGHGVSDSHDGWEVTVPRAAASGVNGSRTGVVSGGQRASSGGNASGTVRTETSVGMAGEIKMFLR